MNLAGGGGRGQGQFVRVPLEAACGSRIREGGEDVKRPKEPPGSLVRGERGLWGGWSSSCPPVSKGLWLLILEMNWDSVLREKGCDLQMARPQMLSRGIPVSPSCPHTKSGTAFSQRRLIDNPG